MRLPLLVPLTAVGLVAVGAALFTLATTEVEPAGAEQTVASRSDARPRSRPRRTRPGSLSRPRPRESGAPALEVALARHETLGTDPAANAEVIPTAAETEAVIAAHEDELVARLQQEPRDPQWSDATEVAIDDAFREDAFAAGRLVEAECRATLCRIELTAPEESGRERLVSALPLTYPFSTNGLIRQRADEDGTVVVLFTREGATL